MKKIGFFLVVLLFVSCAAVNVNYDYDKETDFSSYSTYNYYPNMETGLSGLDTKRILVLVDSTMQAKGIKLSEEPDFFINIESASYKAPQNNNVGVGLGGSGRNLGGGISIGLPLGNAKQEREIQFDLVDSQKEFLFWEATGVSSFNEKSSPEAREKNLQAIVSKVFEKYPPNKLRH
ncbi:DUF4136 domain-containing protein [Cellulophaga sp. HaHaR_3_176]|uniref:DUF4136 domain-containing protein n=1 Tax=Cellulophaga sp. HaHaR_3_176 TaxID=1942464 RepID=UPI001C1FF719|nr:DUF4136 domain-containing protein [Cellulophaga sp. HaHaR_3_176]QWX82976.1 DUF4136 domain-containing protein [Cellulophaga sp. HaHaR_3_176]